MRVRSRLREHFNIVVLEWWEILAAKIKVKRKSTRTTTPDLGEQNVLYLT